MRHLTKSGEPYLCGAGSGSGKSDGHFITGSGSGKSFGIFVTDSVGGIFVTSLGLKFLKGL